MSRFLIFLLPLALLLASCGNQKDQPYVTPQTTVCASGVAQIGVGDGFLTDLCGCSEGVTKTVPGQGALVCTVPAGTILVFNYMGTTLAHQIVSLGTPSFASSPVSNPVGFDPGDPSITRVHAIQLATPGTYEFQDAYDSALDGQIVVQ